MSITAEVEQFFHAQIARLEAEIDLLKTRFREHFQSGQASQPAAAPEPATEQPAAAPAADEAPASAEVSATSETGSAGND